MFCNLASADIELVNAQDPASCRFELLIGDLLQQLMNPGQTGGMPAVLRRVCEELEIESAGVWCRYPGTVGPFRVARRCAWPDGPDCPRCLDLAEDTPWITGRISRGRTVSFSRVSQLPEQATTDRMRLERSGIRSSVAIPVMLDGEVQGVVAFDMLRQEREWPEQLLRRLGMIANIIGSGLSLRREQAKLRKCETDRSLERLRSDGDGRRPAWPASPGTGAIVGSSAGLRKVLTKAEQVSGTDSTVLILGETGTGKELLARHIHDTSRRCAKPFITTNLAAIPGTLLESELFGREKGAYTGAMTRQAGRFELADGGTLFLDEIGEMPLETQAKLLRVLQSGELERLGSGRTQKVNVRVIAATNRKLPEQIRAGSFREDLYYRLNIFPITLPPLRERVEDIPLLVWSFVRELSERMGKPIDRIRKEDLEALGSYSWPGNVRELRNLVERSMILASGSELALELPDQEGGVEAQGEGVASRTLRDVQRQHILRVLGTTKGRLRGPGGAAEVLGMKPTTLYSLMERLGIERNPTKAS